MRTIKFRAWDGSNMLGPLTIDEIANSNPPVHLFVNRLKERWGLMQYTDVKDSTGKEIYEGDILVIRTHRDHVVTVEWDRGGFSLFEGSRPFASVAYASNRKKQGEVIGNVYQNAGLLK